MATETTFDPDRMAEILDTIVNDKVVSIGADGQSIDIALKDGTKISIFDSNTDCLGIHVTKP